MNVTGLDISTNTGLVQVNSDFEIVFKQKVKFKSYSQFYATLMESVNTEYAVVEDYAYGAQGQGKSLLAELGGITKLVLDTKKIDYITVSPISLKAFCGSGGANKEDRKNFIKSVYNITLEDDDIADAYILSLIGLTAFENNCKFPYQRGIKWQKKKK